MNPLTLEWINKAEGDLDTARREIQARKRPNYDAACFHAQQMAEKYLKAFLQEKSREIPRIHNLVELVTLCVEIDPSFSMRESDFKTLDRYAVRVRYPGESATKDEARFAVKIADSVRVFVRTQLDLE
jgi:HEPN domain-containing protein